MDYKINGSILAVRLYTGEDVIGSLNTAFKTSGKPLGIMLSAAGMMKEVKLGYFTGKGNYKSHYFEKPMEIVSFTGNIINNGEKIFTHLHVSLADGEGRVSGGHLQEAGVFGTGELFLYLSDMKNNRVKEEETGLEGLKL